MKRITLATVGSLVFYWALFFLARVTGSGVLSSGPLDWLFTALFYPGVFLCERVFGFDSEWQMVLVCWLVYAPVFGFLSDVALRSLRKKKAAAQ